MRGGGGMREGGGGEIFIINIITVVLFLSSQSNSFFPLSKKVHFFHPFSRILSSNHKLTKSLF
jgi:hypothetical protein